MAPKKQNRFLAQAEALKPAENPVVINPTEKISVPASRLEEFADLISEHYPNAYLYEKTILNGGMNPIGVPNVALAIKCDDPKGMATVWYNGSATLTGEFVELAGQWRGA